MQCWSILGIEPTGDEKVIRRAYSKKLKATRPDEDAAAYQALREAYEHALKIAPYYQDNEEDEEEWFGEEDSEQAVEKTVDFANLSDNSTACEVEENEPILVSLDSPPAETTQAEITFEYSPLNIQESYSEEITDNTIAINETTENDIEEESIDSNILFAEDILDEIAAIYYNEGEVALVREWQTLTQKIEQVSFEEYPFLSWQLLDRFFNYPVSNIYLINLWANYFKWHQDYSTAEQLSAEQFYELQSRIENAQIEIGWAEKPDYLDNQNAEVIQFEALSKKETFYQGFIFRSKNQYSQIISIFYAFLAWLTITTELRTEARWQLEINNKRLTNIFTGGQILRVLFRVGLLIAVVFSKDLWGLVEHLGFLVISYTFSFFIISFLLVCLSLIGKIGALGYYLIEGNRVINTIRLFVLPILAWLLFHSKDYLPLQYEIAIKVTSVLLLAYSISFAYIKYIHYPWHIAGFVLSTAGVFIFTEDHFTIYLITALWWNINTYLHIYETDKLKHYYEIMTKPFIKVPYDKELLKFPFNAIRSTLLWFLLLPTIAGNHTMRSNQIYGVLENLFISLLIINAIMPYYDKTLYLLYPIILFVYVCNKVILKWVASKLNVQYA